MHYTSHHHHYRVVYIILNYAGDVDGVNFGQHSRMVVLLICRCIVG